MNVLWFCCFVRQINRLSKRRRHNNFEPPIKYPRSCSEELDPKHYIIENKSQGIYGRAPGEICGQPFNLQNCKNVYIYLFDHMNTLFVDDCENCVIFTGPIKTSLFIRNCKFCHIMTSCQQFRSRDCAAITTFLACATEPIIESSTLMKFGRYQCAYPELDCQFLAAGLSIFNCNWSDIYDFTPNPGGEPNVTLLPAGEDISKYILTPINAIEKLEQTADLGEMRDEYTMHFTEAFTSVALSLNAEDALVPLTWGHLTTADNEVKHIPTRSCAIVNVFESAAATALAKTVISLVTSEPQCKLVRTRQSLMSVDDKQRIFGVSKTSDGNQRESVITLEFTGPHDCVGKACEEAVQKSGPMYDSTTIQVISDSKEARRQIVLLNGLCGVQLNIV